MRHGKTEILHLRNADKQMKWGTSWQMALWETVRHLY